MIFDLRLSDLPYPSRKSQTAPANSKSKIEMLAKEIKNMMIGETNTFNIRNMRKKMKLLAFNIVKSLDNLTSNN